MTTEQDQLDAIRERRHHKTPDSKYRPGSEMPYPNGGTWFRPQQQILDDIDFLLAHGRPYNPMSHNHAKNHCECCRRPLTRRDVAALAEGHGKRWAWCFDCWDNDERAVEQYRALPFPPFLHYRNPAHSEV